MDTRSGHARPPENKPTAKAHPKARLALLAAGPDHESGYGKSLTALAIMGLLVDGASFTLEPGKMLGLVGAASCGR